MAPPVKPSSRPYHAPRRAAAAAQTREAIVAVAQARFEASGWVATTMAAIAADAGVSPKTIEASFATKAKLLAAVADYAIRGDVDPTPMADRGAVQAERDARDAATMLDLHARRSAGILSRSAHIAWVVESAAAADKRVAELWAQMTHNLRYGVDTAAETLLAKPGLRAELTPTETREILLIAMHWSTYCTLTGMGCLDVDAVDAWIKRYYGRMLLT